MILLLIILWLPILALIRIFDRDTTRYRTGYFFRKLGKAISRVNPYWKVTVGGHRSVDDRKPYVVVSNHLSNADIPVISNLPWEMKWVAKRELFAIPMIGWMMKLAGDIPVDRRAGGQKVRAFRQMLFYLRNNTSVIFFPEGTRSRSGKLNRFSRGAFELAIREQVPVLPLVIDGTHNCLPKNSWIFKKNVHARLEVLEPISTKGMNQEQVEMLVELARDRIAGHLMKLRNCPRKEVDAMVTA
ncbi:MAG: lysophospholipid acyltransferase family protein [Balneolaceae bacterium]